MKSIISIIFISFILLSCSKQTINLDEKVQRELIKIELLCQRTNIVTALYVIDKNCRKSEIQDGFSMPSYASFAILKIISNSYNVTDLDKMLSNTNDIKKILASSIFFAFAKEPDNSINKAYKAYKMDATRIKALLITLESMISFNNELDEKAKLLLDEYNRKSTNEFTKLLLVSKYNINQKKFDIAYKFLSQFRRKYPKHELFYSVNSLLFRLYAKIHSKEYKTKSSSKEIFNLCKKLYENGYRDIWFGMVLGKEALKREKYKLAVKGFEMCIDLSQKYDMTFYSDNLLAFYGFALQKCGRKKDAIKVFNDALELNPTNKYAISFMKDLE